MITNIDNDKRPFLALESLTDLSVKCSKAMDKSFGANEYYVWNKSFDYNSWYSRVNILNVPDRGENENAVLLNELKDLCDESGSPKFLTLSKEDVYAGFGDGLISCGFKLTKQQKGMLYDLSEINGNARKMTESSESENKNGEISDSEKSKLENSSVIKKGIGDEQGEDGAECSSDRHISEIGTDKIAEFNYVGEQAFGTGGKLEAFQILVNDPGCHFYIYEIDGHVAATAMLNICSSAFDGSGIVKNGGVHEVATLPEYRNRGMATKLMKHIIAEGARYGLDILSLQASVFGEPVYKKLGFEIVSHIDNYAL